MTPFIYLFILTCIRNYNETFYLFILTWIRNYNDTFYLFIYFNLH